MIINTNYPAMSAARLLDQSSVAQRKALARLSSGSKITSPEDDGAGLAVALKASALAQRDNAVQTTLGNAISFSQTQDGYLQKVQKALDRMSEIAVLAQDATKTDKDRSNYDSEFQSLTSFIQDSFQKTFNGINLFGAAAGASTTAVNGFTGTYGISNWNETDVNNNGDGSVNTSGAPSSIVLTGPDAGGSNGEINFETTAQAGGTVSFDWNFSSSDPQPNLDDAGYLINGVYTKIVDTGSQGNGTVSFTVNAGDTFGFSVRAGDNQLGPGIFTISNFSAPEASASLGIVTDGDGVTTNFDLIQPISIGGSVSSSSSAVSALTSVKSSIETLASRRALVGAKIALLQSYSDTASTLETNLRESVSRIMDTDVATESTNLARQSILVQSGTAMLAQANTLPQAALRLLG